MSSLPHKPRPHNGCRRGAATENHVDWREQLVNNGATGPIDRVSVAEELIVVVRGIMLDFDPHLLRPHLFSQGTGEDADRLFRQTVNPWLNRHELWRNSEVRFSGTGLHVLLWLEPWIEINHEGERQRWSGITKVLQAAFPTDPVAPGITALTRPVGSINSKSGQPVRIVKKGQPVSPAAIISFFDQLRNAPFHSVAALLFGRDRISPCPICVAHDSTLTVQSGHGECYGRCGRVEYEQLMDAFFLPTPTVRGR